MVFNRRITSGADYALGFDKTRFLLLKELFGAFLKQT